MVSSHQTGVPCCTFWCKTSLLLFLYDTYTMLHLNVMDMRWTWSCSMHCKCSFHIGLSCQVFLIYNHFPVILIVNDGADLHRVGYITCGVKTLHIKAVTFTKQDTFLMQTLICLKIYGKFRTHPLRRRMSMKFPGLTHSPTASQY